MPGDPVPVPGDTADPAFGLAHADIGESAGGRPHRVIVYGARAHWVIPAEVDTQLWLSHQVREELVEINRAYQQRVREVWSGRPEIATVEADLATVETQVIECAERAAKERSAARSKRIRTPTTEALAAAKARSKDLRARRRELISAARQDPAVRAALDCATQDQAAAEKASYQQYCTAGVEDRDGRRVKMYWANHNIVLIQHQAAVKRINARRAVGQPADLRHHRYDGTGAVNIVLQRQKGKPARSPELLASDLEALIAGPRHKPVSPWGKVLTLDTTVRRGYARFRVATGQHVTVPLTFHRPLPADCEIIHAKLMIRRTAGHRSAALHVTIAEDTPTHSGGDGRPAIAVHLGWRAEADGIRVATWRTTTPVTVPAAVSDIVRADPSGVTGTIRLPESWRRGITRAEQLASERGIALEDIRAQLLAHLQQVPPTQGWPEAAEVTRWRSPARFAALTLRHRDQPPAGRQELCAALEQWRRTDRRKWETEAHTRAKMVKRRADAWARAAHWVVSVCGALVVDDTSIADLARTPAPSPDSLPTEVERIAVAQRRDAAPGALRERLRLTAQRQGLPVVQVPHTGLTRTHHGCGHLNPPDLDYATRPVTCQGCGQGFDPDASATAAMLTANAPAPPETPGSLRGTV